SADRIDHQRQPAGPQGIRRRERIQPYQARHRRHGTILPRRPGHDEKVEEHEEEDQQEHPREKRGDNRAGGQTGHGGNLHTMGGYTWGGGGLGASRWVLTSRGASRCMLTTRGAARCMLVGAFWMFASDKGVYTNIQREGRPSDNIQRMAFKAPTLKEWPSKRHQPE